MTEEKIIEAIRIISQKFLVNVEGLFCIVYFDFTDQFFTMNNMPGLLLPDVRSEFIESIIRQSELYEDLIYKMNKDTDPLTVEIVSLVDRLPCTCLQILSAGDFVSMRYYSSRENSLKHLHSVLKKYVQTLG